MPGQPRWRQIAEDLSRRIEDGDFAKTGRRRQLPKEMELCDEYEASRNTVRDAIAWLVDRGLVETERGKGTFVVFMPEPLHITLSAQDVGPGGGEGNAWRLDAQKQGREPEGTALRVEIQAAADESARYLQVPDGTQLVVRHEQLLIDRRPWSLQTSYYPLDFAQRGATRLLQASDITEGAVAYLAEALGYEQAGYHDEIAVRLANGSEVDFFGLSERANVLVYETYRTAYDTDGRPFRLTVTIWPADRNRLHYNVGAVPTAVERRPGDIPGPDR